MNNNIKLPNYDSWCVLFKNDTIIGYVHNSFEADKICEKISEYSWDFGLTVWEDPEMRNEIYNKLDYVYVKL